MKRLMVISLALALCLALAPAAMAAKVRGVTDTQILLGQWGPQTGPAALWGAVARGSDLLFKLVNQDGGVHGRKIKHIIRDDAYQPNRTKAIAKDLVENLGVFAFACGVGTSPGLAVMDYLVKNNVPWVGMATGSSHWAKPLKRTVFATYPDYGIEAKAMVKYALDKLKKKKIAFLYTNDDYGKGGLDPAVAYLKSRGMKLVAAVPTEVSDTDLASHVLKMRKAGAEVVIMQLLPKQAIIARVTAAKMGWAPQFMACSTLSDTPLMFKLSRGLWKGVIFGNFIELADSKHPLMVKYRKAWKKYAPKERWGVFYYAGIGFIEPMVEGFKRAGRNLTVASFIKGLESIKNFQGIMGKVSFSPTDHQGTKSIFLAKAVGGGKSVRLTDWMEFK